MIITVTSIRLRSVWHFFKLSLFGMKIVRQTKQEKGFVRMKNTGFGYMHYTLSVWESEEDMKRFARSGAHAAAMQQSKNIADEIRTYTYTGEQLPSWQEVKRILKEKGKVLTF
ncbi:MAG: DUF3291 domain-containing protein [Bacteroidia bacterium]|nr:DUF3291 domain-containing protein [Bacteroidia bacterium]